MISAALVAGRWHTSRLLLGLGHIGEAKVCHALMLGLDLLKGLAGAGKAAVRSRGLDSAAFSTVVQGSPGRTGRHGEFCGRNWREVESAATNRRQERRELSRELFGLARSQRPTFSDRRN